MNKRIEEKLVLKKSIKIFLSKLFILIIIFLIGLIATKKNPTLKKNIEKEVYEKNIKFTKTKSIYEKFPEFRYRLKVKAGLTGYAQVYGKYNTSLRDKLLLDLLYIENYSILTDIKLILMTVKIIFSKDSTEGVDENTDLNL